MSELLKSVDERANLAGTNKLEILLFKMGVSSPGGKDEIFGINVFKVREVMTAPPITAVPNAHPSCVGMISMRGSIVPVLDIGAHIGVHRGDLPPPGHLIITEYNGKVQGFLVDGVENIIRLAWKDIHAAPDMLSSSHGGVVTAVSELDDTRIMMLIDVERILSETAPSEDDAQFAAISRLSAEGMMGKRVFFVDDSMVARKQIEKTLDAMGVEHMSAVNGARAWQALSAIAAQCEAEDQPVRTRISMILTDVEMPELDGYALTKNIKSDPRFNGIPVLMHSSLSGTSNQALGKSVGVDEYIPKFEPQKLALMVERLLASAVKQSNQGGAL